MLRFVQRAASFARFGEKVFVSSLPILPHRTFSQIRNRMTLAVSHRTFFDPQFVINRQAHGLGSNSMVEYLSAEISEEKKQSKPLPKFSSDFTVETNGSLITLLKKHGDENVSVRINVNYSVEADDIPSADDEGEPTQHPNEEVAEFEESDKMVSRPRFTVSITRPGQQTLNLFCSIHGGNISDSYSSSDDEDQPEHDSRDAEVGFGIEEINFTPKPDLDQESESTYTVTTSMLDDNMYDLLLAILDQRGINNSLIQNVVGYTTAYEHKLYVDFLEQLKKMLK